MDETRNCTQCKGSGKTEAWGSIPERSCVWCNGRGTFVAPDVAAIIAAIKGRKGLRSQKPQGDKRAAYVWRMARFHGGKDVTLPVMASLDVRGDPFADELNALSESVAKDMLGTDTAGAARWHRAFYG